MTTIKYGLEEGDTCNRNGCNGEIELVQTGEYEGYHRCIECDWNDESGGANVAAVITDDENMSGPVAAKVDFAIDVRALEIASKKLADSYFKEHLDLKINQCVDQAIKNAYGSQFTLNDALTAVIREKLDTKYPDIVDEKVDELAAKIKDFAFDWNSRENARTMRDQAEKRIKEYIDNELMQSVTKTKESLEEYGQQYFAKNLFRAMNLMSASVPDDVLSNALTSKSEG